VPKASDKTRKGVKVGASMRKVLVWVGALVVVAGAAAAVVHFDGNLFRSSPTQATAASSWEPMPHPPGDRSQPMIALIREFGVWHLSCVKRPKEPPKVGFIENLGIVQQSNQSKAHPCRVFIMMRNTGDPKQMVMLMVHYGIGVGSPEIEVMYRTVYRPDVAYDPSGQILDLSKKGKAKLKGGFWRGQKLLQSPEYQEARSQDVGLQLTRKTLAIPTRLCHRGHCFARLMVVDIADLETTSKLVLRLPGKPRQPPRIVNVPTDGLRAALTELGRLSNS
jgi:hypothetical protein